MIIINYMYVIRVLKWASINLKNCVMVVCCSDGLPLLVSLGLNRRISFVSNFVCYLVKDYKV